MIHASVKERFDKSIRPFPSPKENKCEEIFGKSIRSIVHYIKCNIVTMTFTFIIRTYRLKIIIFSNPFTMRMARVIT